GLPALTSGDIVLGSNAGGATGTVLLQSSGDINTSALAGLVALENNNTAAVGLRSGGVLTLLDATNALFDFGPDTLALNGDDIRGTTFSLSFDVNNLIFDSGGDTSDVTLTGDIGRLSATVLNFNGITVNVDGAINLTDIISGDDITVTAGSVGTPGNITVGALNAQNDVSLTANFNGAII